MRFIYSGFTNDLLPLYPNEYPYEALSFLKAMANPATFSEYTEINGRKINSRKDMLEWLNQKDNPFRTQKPDIKGKKAQLVLHTRFMDFFEIYADLTNDDERNRMFQGLWGKGKEYKDYSQHFKQTYGLLANYRQSIRDGILSNKYKVYKSNSLNKEISIDKLQTIYQNETKNNNLSLTEAFSDTKLNTPYSDFIAVYTLQNKKWVVDTNHESFYMGYIQTGKWPMPIIATKNPPLKIEDKLMTDNYINYFITIGNSSPNSSKQNPYVRIANLTRNLNLLPNIPKNKEVIK